MARFHHVPFRQIAVYSRNRECPITDASISFSHPGNIFRLPVADDLTIFPPVDRALRVTSDKGADIGPSSWTDGLSRCRALNKRHRLPPATSFPGTGRRSLPSHHGRPTRSDDFQEGVRAHFKSLASSQPGQAGQARNRLVCVCSETSLLSDNSGICRIATSRYCLYC